MNETNSFEGKRLMRDYKTFFPEVYEKINGTEFDPSEDDEKIPLFWARVRELFEEHYNKTLTKPTS